MAKKTKLTQGDSLKQIEEWKNKYLRALADYHNLEKRVEESRETIRKRANRDLLLRLLEILDTVYAAEVFIKDPGLKLVVDKFTSLLSQEGVTEIDLLGKEYDPFTAECTEVVPGEKDNIVVDVVQKGYKQYDEVIRPARVRVSKKL